MFHKKPWLACIVFVNLLMSCKTTTVKTDSTMASASNLEQKSELIWFGDNFSSKKDPNVRQRIGYLKVTRNTANSGLRPINHCTVIHGYGLSLAAAEKIQNSEMIIGNFVNAYFGPKFSSYMLDHACNTLYFPVVDSNDSTILEMTVRMEKFLKVVSCEQIASQLPAPYHINKEAKQRACAVIGHSKGGAVVTNMARRCMQEISEMGQATCERVAEFYSATGVNQGAGAAILLYGAKGAGPLTEKMSDYYFNFNWHKNDRIAGDVFGKEIATGIGFAWNVDGDELSNPTWFDLHPGTPMENGVPLYVINNIALERKGWFKGDYAASGGAKAMDGAGTAKIGCGKPLSGSEANANRIICHAFGSAVGQVHSSGLKNLFADGLRYSKNNNRFFDPKTKNSSYLKAINWDTYNLTDGFAEVSSTLGVCRRSPTFKNNCIQFEDLNHQATAGGAQEATSHMAEQLKHETPKQ